MDRNFIYQRLPGSEGGVCHVFLLGTAHSTEESCARVRGVIHILGPQKVVLELCDEWYTEMLSEEPIQAQTLKNLFYMWRNGEKTLIDFLYCWYLMKRGGSKMLVDRSEFKAAYNAANRTHSEIVAADIHLRTTIDNIWARMSLLEKANVACGLLFKIFLYPIPELFHEFRGIDDEDIVLLDSLPPYGTLVEQRNRSMTNYLREEAETCSTLVAVVDRRHLNGVRKHWITAFLKFEQPSAVKMCVSLEVAIVAFGSIYLWRKNK